MDSDRSGRGRCRRRILFLRSRGSTSGYEEDTAQVRNIVTYHSFTGTIEPVTERNVLPDLAGVKITAVNVEEGDSVKAGDIVATLDSTNLEEQIRELEATMTAAEKQSAVSLEQAQTTYSDYKNNIDSDSNSQILSAEQAIDSAFAQLVSAQQKYNDEVTANSQSLSQTILSAIQSVDSAYSSVRTAELNASQASKSLDKASDRDDGSLAAADSVDSAQNSADSTALSLDEAWVSYNDAKKNYDAAKLNEESQLTADYDSLVTAQTSYLNALDTYNTQVKTAGQQLNSYALQIDSAKAGADQSVNSLKLADLKRQLDECTVLAPIDGVVTALSAKEGDVAATGSSLATITSFDKMKVEIKINEYDIQGVSEGKPVTITVDALTDKTYEGTISKISRVATVDNGVSYFKSEVDFNGDDDTRSGMSVEVKLTINDKKNILAVPSTVIATDEDGTAYVLTYADESKKKIVKKQITAGVTDGTYTEITDGLSEGEIVLSRKQTDTMSMYMDSGAAGSNSDTRSGAGTQNAGSQAGDDGTAG
jgi:HlyD family secretion protein